MARSDVSRFTNKRLYSIYLSNRLNLLKTCLRTCLTITKLPIHRCAARPMGIARPAPISSALADFLEVPNHTLLARTEVISRIAKYIKKHKLENPANRREINIDARLQTLMPGWSPGEVVTYFNIQRYVRGNFPKTMPCQPIARRLSFGELLQNTGKSQGAMPIDSNICDHSPQKQV